MGRLTALYDSINNVAMFRQLTDNNVCWLTCFRVRGVGGVTAARIEPLPVGFEAWRSNHQLSLFLWVNRFHVNRVSAGFQFRYLKTLLSC